MISTEKIKTNFSFIPAWFGDTQVYHDTDVFEEHGDFCDLYFKSVDKEIKEEQVDIYSKFKNYFKNYVDEIEVFINNNLTYFETNKLDEIKRSILFFDVIEVPFDNSKYDLVLVCGKTYKTFPFRKKSISIRIEFKNGQILSIRRKKDTTTDND